MSLRFHTGRSSTQVGWIWLSVDFKGGTTMLHLSQEEAMELITQIKRGLNMTCAWCPATLDPDERHECGLCGCGYFCEECIGPHKVACEEEHR